MGLLSYNLNLVLAKPSVSFVPLLLFQDKSFTSKRLKVSKRLKASDNKISTCS